MTIAQARKFIVALLGALAVLVAQGTVTGDAATWVTFAVSLATAAGVYVVPNEQP